MKEIQLTQGKTTLIDDDDYERVSEFKWHTKKVIKINGTFFYAKRNVYFNGKQKTQYLHHFLIGYPPDKLEVDHINRNSLDNRKQNLRICTRSQNCMNRTNRKSKPNKGYYLKSENNKWCAKISINKKQMHIGYFDTEKEAIIAYNEAAIKHYGEYANLNK